MSIHRFILAATVIVAALAVPTPSRAADPAVQHLVLFQFKDDLEYAKLTEILEAFERLPARIPGIRGFQWGTNNSPEGLAAGFTHGFIITFENAAARDAYLPHPAHAEFGSLVRPALEDVFVIDFDVEEPPPVADPGRVHHLVFFKFQESASAEQIEKVNQAFAELPRKISGLLSYQAGRNHSPEGLAKGFTHGYLLSFVNERARDDYLPHPAHKEFVSIVGPVLEQPLVLDFTVAPSRQELFVTEGLEPYRVYQRGEDGRATIRFGGIARLEGPIEARLREGRRTVEGQDWRVVGKAERGRFTAELADVPTGGEYTVEVRHRDAIGNVTSHTEVANILVGDIWILAGQSNMEGVGNLEEVEPSSPQVHCFTMGHRWELAKEPLHWLVDSPDPVHNGGWFRENPDEAGRREIRSRWRAQRRKGAGLGLPFANELVRRTGVPIGLVAAAHGGTSMEQWDPAKRDQGGASLYGSMLKQVRNAGGKARGVLWYQGESDANPNAAPLFAERFEKLVAAFRADLDDAELPFYSVQIGQFVRGGSSESWDRIQELQRQLAREIPRTAVISVIDLPLDDLIHVGTSGLKRAGRRLAKIAHRELFGEISLQRGPRLVGARAEAGGRVVRVEYADVNGRLLPAEKVEGFTLRKADGSEVPLIYKAFVDPWAPTQVVLELQQPLPEDAALHYGAGFYPVCNLVDAEDMAACVFGPVEIAR